MTEEECLVLRRPKRSTAGNRMEVALAELALEELQEVEEDIDFVVDREEEDVFESDFASTDEEAAQEDVEEGDKVAREEERRERKTARARVEKATAAAHARQRVTFHPGATTPQLSAKVTQKPKRRVSLGVAVNAETGEVIEGATGMVGAKRQSQRRHTIMNTSATVNRIRDAEEKRAAIPKKTKMATRLPTQDELIARALDTEEGNISEHRNYLRLEEEKRAKARVAKQAIEGPVLRWISKKEAIRAEVQLPPPLLPTTTSANLYAAKYSFVYTSNAGGVMGGSQAYSMPFYAYTPLVAHSAAASRPQEASGSVSVTAAVPASGNTAAHSKSASTTPTSLVTPTSSLPSSSNVQDPVVPTTSAISSVISTPSWQYQLAQPQFQPQPQTPTQIPPALYSYQPASTPFITHRTEDVCKNYIIHESSQSVPSKPPWKDTMSAMFGDHVRWDEVKVFTGKGRPLARPVRTCPITGLPAKYCDPKTNVPFANVGAYEVLTKVLGRGYVWSSTLGCYVGASKMSQRDKRQGAAAEGSASAGVIEGVAGGKGDGGDEAEELEERTPKRPRLKLTEG